MDEATVAVQPTAEAQPTVAPVQLAPALAAVTPTPPQLEPGIKYERLQATAATYRDKPQALQVLLSELGVPLIPAENAITKDEFRAFENKAALKEALLTHKIPAELSGNVTGTTPDEIMLSAANLAKHIGTAQPAANATAPTAQPTANNQPVRIETTPLAQHTIKTPLDAVEVYKQRVREAQGS